MLIDGAGTLLGSANLDPRSLQLNFEFNLEVYEEALTQRLEALIRQKSERGREVTLSELRSRAFPLVLHDNLARLLSPYL